MEASIRILTADDHDLVRRGLSSLIDITPGLELVGQAVDGVEAVDMARSLQPDVILVDLVMPRKSGIEAIAEIVEENPNASNEGKEAQMKNDNTPLMKPHPTYFFLNPHEK